MTSTLAAPLRASTAPLAAGTFYGGWQLVRFLGAGNFTRVYQARPAGSAAGTPADYALKIPAPRQVNEAAARCLLAREAAVARRVAHENLVSVLEARVEEELPFLVMPYLAGVTLRQVLDSRFALALPQALWLVRQAASALAALHQAGWRHGDVKPDHLMIAPTGHATLFDLGLAQRCLAGTAAAEEPLVGTPEYLAPEVLASHPRRDGQVDIYALGVTLFESLTSRRPFAATNISELAVHHLRSEPPDVRSLVPNLPARLARLVRRMLAKEPLRRPDALETVATLAEIEIDVFDWR